MERYVTSQCHGTFSWHSIICRLAASHGRGISQGHLGFQTQQTGVCSLLYGWGTHWEHLLNEHYNYNFAVAKLIRLHPAKPFLTVAGYLVSWRLIDHYENDREMIKLYCLKEMIWAQRRFMTNPFKKQGWPLKKKKNDGNRQGGK